MWRKAAWPQVEWMLTGGVEGVAGGVQGVAGGVQGVLIWIATRTVSWGSSPLMVMILPFRVLTRIWNVLAAGGGKNPEPPAAC